MLPRQEHERAYKLHRQKLDSIKPNLDNNSPKQYPHLVYRNKQIQNEEEKLSKVDHENKILLNKMTNIMKTGGRVDNWNDQPVRRQPDPQRKHKHEKMMTENIQIAKRLEAVKPTYDRQLWEDDYKRHEQYLEMRQEGKQDPIYDRSSFKTSKGKKSEYEDDFESDEEEPQKDKTKGKDRHKNKKDDSSKSSVHSPRDGEVDLSMYWGDYKEADNNQSKNKKDTSRSEKSEKDKTSNKNTKNSKNNKKDEDEKDLQGDRDIKQLFKVCKELLDEKETEEVLIKTLVKKTHKQRMEIKAKFKEKYDLDLDKELKSSLGGDWNVIIDSLLTDQTTAGADSLHEAIEGKNIKGIIENISTKDNQSLSALKDVYRKEYSKSVESAISEKTENPIELLLITLAKTSKDESSDVDGKAAQKDTVELYEFGDGRWSTESGKFIKLVDSKSVEHVKTVLSLYKQVSGGKEALDVIKSECSEDYAEAVTAYVNCTKDPDSYYADKLYKNMGHTDPVFVNTLVERSEIDMPAVCKSYKKKYDADIKEDIDEKCKESTRKVLKALASKTPKAKKGDSENKKKGADKESKGNSKENKGPTVTADPNFDADKDCERLREAMKGLGTDEQVIIDIICSKNNEQRQTLIPKYAKKYAKRDLVSDLKSELSGDFEEVILGLMMTPLEYDAHCLHEAMSGVGTDESMLTTILSTKTPAELKDIKAEYKKAYKKDLDQAIQSDTSGDFRELLLALSKGERKQGDSVNKKEAEEDAKKIHMDGKGKPDDEVFKEIMTKKSSAQVKATFEEYKKISGKDVYETMKKSLKGDAKDAYITLGKASSGDAVTYYTEQLKESADGIGTNDAKLIRIIITRSEIDLALIKEKYKKDYKKSLKEMVESECSGDYKKALIKLIGDNDDDDDDDEEEEGDEEGEKESKAATQSKKTKTKSSKDKTLNSSLNKTSNKTNAASKDKSEVKQKDGAKVKKDQNKKTDNGNNKSDNKKATKTANVEKKKNDAKEEQKKEKKEEVSIDDEVERLYKAMDGLGTDEQTIIDIITSKNNQQRQEIREKYQERYNKDIMSDLKSELSGDLQELILGLMMTPVEYDVDCLHEAMAGMGTDESMLIGVLATRTPEEMKSIKEQYKTAHKKDLEKSIKSETSGDFKELLLELIKGQRPQGDAVDDKISQDEAKKLYKDGKGKLDVKYFKSMFTKYNGTQAKAIFDEYDKISDKTIHQVIDDSLKGDARNGYSCLIKSSGDPVDYYTERLHEAFDGVGTNDSRLIRIVVSRSEIDLPAIKEKYKDVYDKSLPEQIESECSGDYKKALLILVGQE